MLAAPACKALSIHGIGPFYAFKMFFNYIFVTFKKDLFD